MPGSRKKWEAELVEWCLWGYDVFVFTFKIYFIKAKGKFWLCEREGKNMQLAGLQLLASDIKFYIARANLRLPGQQSVMLDC